MVKKRKKDIVIFAVILLFNISCILLRKIMDLDELWNYNFARNIADGLLPYAGFNFIVAPLYPAIESIFLKLIANQLIVSRIFGAIVFTVIVFIGYKILENITENKWIHMYAIIGVLYLYKDWFWSNYNFGMLLITMLVIYLEIQHIREEKWNYNFKYEFLVGIIVGLAIITKQTIGAVLAFTFIMYRWLYIRKKEEVKKAIKISFVRGIGILVPVLIFIVYLLFTNTLADFIDYTIKGISEFTSTFPYRELLTNNGVNLDVKFIAMLLPILIVANFILLWNKKDRILSIMLVFSVQNMIVMYPLCDPSHFLIGVFPMLITTIYALHILVGKYIKIEEDQKLLTGMAVIIIMFLVGISVYNLVQYVEEKDNDIQHFYGIPINEGLASQTKELANYVLEKEKEGKKVYILDMEAALTMIAADKYNKHYDLLVKANFGAKGEEGIIEDIKNEENALFLVRPNNSNNRQSAEKVRNYVKDNFVMLEEFLGYNVYQNPK